MEVIYSLDNFSLINNYSGVALGSFDGVHIGHQTLILKLVEVCKANNIASIVYTFRNHPRGLTSSNGAPPKIVSDEIKFRILKELGVDYVVFVEFDEYQRSIHPDNFIKVILKDKLKMIHGVVGFDYRFGHMAKGNVELLYELQDKYNYKLSVLDAIKIENQVISSTEIRNLLAGGNIRKANLYLGRKFRLTGAIIKGKGLGRELGFPTANIAVDQNLIIPKPGVYYTQCLLDQRFFYSITNVGYNPTIGDNSMSIETHILNFNEDIYGKKIEILFFHHAREEVKFSKITNLVEQVNQDILQAKSFFNI